MKTKLPKWFYSAIFLLIPKKNGGSNLSSKELPSQELQNLAKEQRIWILYISNILHLYFFLWLLTFEGDGGLQKRTLSGITSAVDFFTVLKEKMYLNRENLIFVQACLWNVGRRDLHRKCVEFAKSSEKILHFYCPKDTPGVYIY